MRFATWAQRLADRGIVVVPPSSAVPVDVHALLWTPPSSGTPNRGSGLRLPEPRRPLESAPPIGGVLHFRCRGTAVALRLYDPEAVRVAVPERASMPTEFDFIRERLVPVTPGALSSILQGGSSGLGGRLVIPAGSVAVAEASMDGEVLFGWSLGHEAGRLSVRAAAELFDELWVRLLAEPEAASEVAAADLLTVA